MGQDAAGRIAHFETMSMAERRYAQSGEASGGSRRAGREFRECTRIRKPKRFACFALTLDQSSLAISISQTISISQIPQNSKGNKRSLTPTRALWRKRALR